VELVAGLGVEFAAGVAEPAEFGRVGLADDLADSVVRDGVLAGAGDVEDIVNGVLPIGDEPADIRFARAEPGDVLIDLVASTDSDRRSLFFRGQLSPTKGKDLLLT
jgi:hypothetical protein